MKRMYGKTVKEIMIEYFNKLTNEDIILTKDIVNYFRDIYPKIKESTVIAHLIFFSTNAKSRIHYNGHDNGSSDLLFKINEKTYRLYNKNIDPDPIYKNDLSTTENVNEIIENNDETDREFAYEKDLQNFLSKNLNIIEAGLKIFEEDDITGIEYPAGGRYIDILAIDKDNNFVIIELKVSKGYDRVIGQLLRYIAWVEKNMANDGQKVRGIIICKEISDDLLLACSKVNNIELFEYELSIKLKKVL